jgi:hypothetical protein
MVIRIPPPPHSLKGLETRTRRMTRVGTTVDFKSTTTTMSTSSCSSNQFKECNDESKYNQMTSSRKQWCDNNCRNISEPNDTSYD